MYEMQGTSPGLAASGQPVAWPSRRERAARQSQEPALGSGCPAPPTSRSCPRAVPVSNGESISTASARDRARPAPHLFEAFFVSTGCPQNMAGLSAFRHGFPLPFAQVIHRLPGVTWRNAELPSSRRAFISRAFPIRFPVSTGCRGDYPVKFARPLSVDPRAGSSPGRVRPLPVVRR